MRIVVNYVLSSILLIGMGQAPPPGVNAQEATPRRQPQQPLGVKRGKEQDSTGLEVVRITTTLVMVPVSVIDRDGRYIADLRKDDFHLYEDDTEQEIAFFNDVDQTISVVLLLDMSRSTLSHHERMKKAAASFIDHLRPNDSALPVFFGGEIYAPLLQASTDHSALKNAVLAMKPTKKMLSDTRLYDAVALVANRVFNTGKGRKALILFTDAVGSESRRATRKSNLKDVTELDALIYAVYYNIHRGVTPPTQSHPSDSAGLWQIPQPRSPTRREIEQIREGHKKYLIALSERTGGRFYEYQEKSDMEAIFASIAEELRHQYSIGYYPKVGKKAEVREVRVDVTRPHLVVRTRRRYIYAPSDQ